VTFSLSIDSIFCIICSYWFIVKLNATPKNYRTIVRNPVWYRYRKTPKHTGGLTMAQHNCTTYERSFF